MIEDYYTESAVIYSLTTSTGWGSETAFTAGSTISAAINPASGNERFSAGKVTEFADYKLYCSDTVSLNATQRIVYAGSTFEVGFVKDTFDKSHHKKVMLRYAR